MPTYEYKCKACDREFEYQQRMSDPDKEVCEACGEKALERLLSAPAFHLKGGGWYKDLYASSKPDSKASGDAASKPDAKASGDAASSSSSSAGTATGSTGGTTGSGGSSSGGSSGSGSGSSGSSGSTSGGGSSSSKAASSAS
jgi:putative FmdB family regulatory protein